MTPVREALEPQYQQFRRTAIAEMTPWVEGFDMSRVSVSAPDKEAGSPKPGDMIARNPKNHDDKWLVAAAYFADNFAAASAPSGAHFTDADLDALFEASKRDAHFVGSEIRQLIGDIRTARASAAPGEPCAVKPLEWEARSSDALTFDANTPIGHFIAGLTEDDCGMWFIVGQTTSNRVIGGVEAAKAAAQADYEQRIRSALVAAAARPDTAEARLREALNEVVTNGEWTEGEQRGEWKISKDVYDLAIEARDKTLSPPSGGDEAKESEGGVEGHAGLAPDRQADTVACHRSSTVEAGIKPGPSEPSPPADRREIVARECADELVLTVEAAERVAKRTGNTFVLDRQRVAQMIAGRLAALDGGR